MGICLTNGTTTAAEIVSFAVVTGLTTATGLYSQKFTNFAYTATYLSNIQAFTFPSVLFLRITDDTTNRIMDFSGDGRNWHRFYSVGRTDFMTPTHIGLYCNQATGNVATTITRIEAKIFHWTLA